MDRAKSTSAPVDDLETGTPGRLVTRMRDRLMVRIARRREQQLWLVPLTGEVGELEGDPITLECTNRRGLLSVRGEAELLDSGLICFRIVDPPEVIQRREYVRLPTEQKVSVVGAGVRAIARTLNLSGGGMMLRDLYELEIDDRVHFRIDVDHEQPPVEGWARVVRVGPRGERAFEFEQISKRQRERLIHFIFDRQRASLVASRRDVS
jgi:PilZ domain